MATHDERLKKLEKWFIDHEEWKTEWLDKVFTPLLRSSIKNASDISAIRWLLSILIGLNILSIGLLVAFKILGI